MKDLIFRSTVRVFLLCNTFILAQDREEAFITMFEPKNISTNSVEYSSSFSSSGIEVYFTRSNNKWGTGNMKTSIYYSVKKNGKWSIPEQVSFSSQFDDSSPHLTTDGNTLYFVSKRPSKGVPISSDIWVVKKDETGKWGIPFRLNNPVNSEYREYSPCTDDAGNLYFASDRPNGYGQGDLYIAKIENKKFMAPVNLGNSINTKHGEWNLEVNKKGNLLIFEASGRKENVSSYGDLYISFKSDTKWSIPQNIKELNTSGSDLYPHITHDGKTLFFTSSNSLNSVDTNIYFTEFKPIYEKYKRQAVFLK
ncbi:hypothetical protein [Aquimarina algiphila]|uniref:hypothetical protein n=1 Tax=Aquimarina algiphila TaxID=2047982 RepID=UPI00232EE06D|nr:hypothetical protein [Aquimarina algiphila]